MPLLVPCPVTRRSSPAEDYMWTLNGVSTLIDQQQQLLKLFQNTTSTTTKQNDIDGDDVKNTTHVSDNNDVRNGDSSKHTSGSHNSLDKYKTNSTMEVRQDLTRSSSSSMQTLRRILEIEELRKFSDILESKIDRKFIK